MEEEVVRIQVVPVGASKKVKSELVVTDARVYGEIKRGIFGEEELSIPIDSIDTVFLGWKRHGILLALGVLGLLGGGAAIMFADLEKLAGIVCCVIGAIFLLIFWLLRPPKLLVNSGKFSIGGQPRSVEEARNFMSVLNAQILSRAAKPEA